jgi:hypothetical protein
LKKWALFGIAAAFIAIGCGGNCCEETDTGLDSSNGTDSSNGVGLASVLLGNKPGQIEVSFLTGQGRSTREVGDLLATMGVTEFADTNGEIVRPILQPAPKVLLNGYQNQIFRVNADVLSIIQPDTGRPLNSRLFQNYTLQVQDIRQTLSGGNRTFGSVENLPQDYSTSLRVFPARFTSLPVFINDGQFEFVQRPGPDPDIFETVAVFLNDSFRSDNSLDVSPRLPSFLSDYLAFDVSGLSADDRPQLSTGEAASRIYFSGDTYAMSQGGERGLFEAINTNGFDPGDPAASLIEGRFAPAGQLGVTTPSGLGSTPGTYSLIQPDPSDPFAIARITSVQGIWRDYKKMLRNMNGTLVITFPSSLDGEEQDVLFIRQTVQNDGNGNTVSATIQSVYYGNINLGSREIRVYPLRNLNSASTDGEVVGQVTAALTRDGVPTTLPALVRQGTYSITLPGFPSTGNFVVYRQ